MDVPGHALRKIIGMEGMCECGDKFHARYLPPDKRLNNMKVADAVMDEHRKHLHKILKKES